MWNRSGQRWHKHVRRPTSFPGRQSEKLQFRIMTQNANPTLFPCCIIILICLTHVLLVLVYSRAGSLEKHKRTSKTSLMWFNVLFTLHQLTAESALRCPKVQLLRLLIIRIPVHPCGTKVSASQMHRLCVVNTLPEHVETFIHLVRSSFHEHRVPAYMLNLDY